MLTVIGFLAVGILLGRLLRRHEKVSLAADRLMTLTIYVFLFFLGITVGANEQIISALPQLGLKTLIIAVAGIIGSILVSYPLHASFSKDTRNED